MKWRVRAGARASAYHETEKAMGLFSRSNHKSGKDIRLTEYAACAG
jgi:hypothetical protein